MGWIFVLGKVTTPRFDFFLNCKYVVIMAIINYTILFVTFYLKERRMGQFIL